MARLKLWAAVAVVLGALAVGMWRMLVGRDSVGACVALAVGLAVGAAIRPSVEELNDYARDAGINPKEDA